MKDELFFKKYYDSVMRQLLTFNVYNKNKEVIYFAKDAILEEI